MMQADCECVVIGAGVVGLAVAAALAQAGREVIVLDGEADYGSVTSARNSEVIHAGIYYAKGSLKATYCVEGKKQLYAYCAQRQIAHRRCGKLIIATDRNQLAQLASIKRCAAANGVDDITELSAARVQSMEPQLDCHAALLSPSTGIVDSHALMVSLLSEAENHGAVLVCRTRVYRMEHLAQQACYRLTTNADGSDTITARMVVNAAGHGACEIANSVLTCTSDTRYEARMIKGNYFSLTTAAPFSRLVYPVPEQAGLGVHLTIDLAGRARFGPDVEPVNDEDYNVDPDRSLAFYSVIRRYWPQLPDQSLVPDYSGIRPRVSIDGELYPDFLVQGPTDHGLPGLVNLMGIESPGLTASLAIADVVKYQLS